MTTQRDELAREIHSTEQLGCGCCTDYNYTREQDQHADKLDVNPIAVAIGDTLLAAGWTKPRTITTVEWGVRYSDSGHTSRRSSQAVAEQAAAEHNQLDMTTWVQSFTMTVVSRTVSEWEPTA